MLEKTFYELIRVALGKQTCLSHTPSADDWKALYEMAKKQSLVGVCFAGVQRLMAQRQAPNSWGSPEGELLYLQWMGMAAKIQQRNEVVNLQCVEVQKMLEDAGFRSAILKGQGVASLYRCEASINPTPSTINLQNLRQSGDIDIWVEGGMEKVLAWCREKYGAVEFDYINAHVPVYDNTEVEVHWRSQALMNLFLNRKLQEWLKSSKVQSSIVGGKAVLANGSEIVVPTAEFNAFYILLHCYHHMFESGLGLRQLMDYYFVLVAYANENESELSVNFSVNALLKEFGMEKFARSVMWLLEYVFDGNTINPKPYTLNLQIEPDEKEGRFLLKEVMQNGNFGHHDDRVKRFGNEKMQALFGGIQHNWHLATHYPSEFFWAPIWLVYHWFWKRI